MLILNKVCILINWSREIDMYSELINSLPSEKVDIIINDLDSLEKEREGNFSQIRENLEKKNISFKYFSHVYKKAKYRIIISSGFAHSSKISFYSLIKFIYGRTFGQLMDITGLSILLKKIFNRPFNAGGKNSRIGDYAWYPERIIAEKSIRYPTGMDLKLRYYPHENLKKNFDIFFTHSRMEADLIKKKFEDKVCKIIGYPRYNALDTKDEICKKLKNEFNFDINKKIILWTPTHIYFQKEINQNIYLWIDTVSKLSNNFNIIIRPHPKSINKDKKIYSNLIKKNFFVDTKSDRKIGELYKISDLVIGDYGGTIFSAIYLERPVVLLNMTKNSEFLKQQISNLSLDIDIRNIIKNFDIDIDYSNFQKYIFKSLENDYILEILKLKKKLFGETKDYESSKNISQFILDQLK